MIELSVSLASSGVVKVPGYEQLVRFGYTKNQGVYRLHIDATGEWEGLTIRAFWHVPDGKDPASSLVTDGSVAVPASVTAQPGNGCITFEGSDGTRTVTSADLRYRVAANSGTEDGTMPEPDSPAWQQLVDAVHKDATAAEQAKTDAQTAASEAATSAGNAAQSAQEAADSLQELKDGIAAGDFKGEKGDTGPQGPKGDVGPAGADGKDGTQIDDTTVGPDAWSSKHIVDMLCPPLEETGNPVVFYPVADYPLGVTASWEPVQEGSGEPSPENIRPISGRDSVKVERCGENLLDEARFPISKTKNHLMITSKMTLPAGTYTVCILSVANGVYADGADVNHTYDSNKHTFTLARPTAVQLKAYWINERPEKDEHIWLVKGNEWRAYTPYIGQTATLTLPRTIYGGTVDAVTGDGQETWGTETISRIASIDELTSVVRCAATLLQKSVTAKSGSAISNWLGEYVSYVEDKESFYTNQTQIYIKISKTRLSSFNVAGVNAYLSEHPLTVCYKLAAPTPFAATGARPIPALSGVNTLMTDADSMTVTGRADPIKRIIDLEDAVASMTNT